MQSVVELISGKDYITGEKTSRAMAAVGIVAGLIPFGKGALKGGTKVVETRRAANVSSNTAETTAQTGSVATCNADAETTGGATPSGQGGVPNNSITAPDPNWQSTQTGTTSGNSAILRNNLGLKSGDGLDAHHAVHSTNRRAAPARAVLDKYQIDINDAVNGVPLVGGKGAPQDILPRHHRGSDLHSHKGTDAVNDRITRIDDYIVHKQLDWATGRDAVLEELSLLRTQILNGSFP